MKGGHFERSIIRVLSVLVAIGVAMLACWVVNLLAM